MPQVASHRHMVAGLDLESSWPSILHLLTKGIELHPDSGSNVPAFRKLLLAACWVSGPGLVLFSFCCFIQFSDGEGEGQSPRDLSRVTQLIRVAGQAGSRKLGSHSCNSLLVRPAFASTLSPSEGDWVDKAGPE